MNTTLNCRCGRTYRVGQPTTTCDAVAKFKIGTLTVALQEALQEMNSLSFKPSGMETWQQALVTCGSELTDPQDACRAYEKPLAVPETGHAVDLTISRDAVDAACAARHSVRVTQGAQRGRWNDMMHYERAQQRVAMLSALRALGIKVKEN